MLWSFLPWIVFFVLALISNLAHCVKTRCSLSSNKELIALFGFLLSYLSLGMSKYQLPHYIFVTFPFAAILTAGYLEQLMNGQWKSWEKPLRIFHLLIFILLWITLIVLMRLPFPEMNIVWMMLATVGLAGLVFLYFKTKKSTFRLIYCCFYTIIGINLLLNAAFYPRLLQFQAGSEIGKWMKSHQIPTEKTGIYRYVIWRSIHFYADGIVQQKDETDLYQKGDYLITTVDQLAALREKQIKFKPLFATFDYPVSRLSIQFLQPDKRRELLEQVVLVKIL
jgi:hypothetical protein